MDQDYERRLLRQINIQNENASPIVSTLFLLVLKAVVNLSTKGKERG